VQDEEEVFRPARRRRAECRNRADPRANERAGRRSGRPEGRAGADPRGAEDVQRSGPEAPTGEQGKGRRRQSLAEQLAEERTARLADREAAKVKGAIVALKEADAIGDKAALGALVKLLASTEEDAVDAAVASLKAQFPTLFKAKAGTRIPASGRGNANPGKPPEDPTEWSPATKKMLGIK
jgi:hypothetical protein